MQCIKADDLPEDCQKSIYFYCSFIICKPRHNPKKSPCSCFSDMQIPTLLPVSHKFSSTVSAKS